MPDTLRPAIPLPTFVSDVFALLTAGLLLAALSLGVPLAAVAQDTGGPDARSLQDADAPRIESVRPAPVVGLTERQWITLWGRGFAEDFTVRLRSDTLVDAHITDRARLAFVSSEEVRVKATFGTEAAAWSAQVIGPDSSVVSNAQSFQVAAPVPTIDEIRPARKVAGGLGFDLAVYGETISEDSEILWNGEALLTTPIYSSTNPEALTIGLKTRVPASAIASPGEQAVAVRTPAPGGGTSTPRALEVTARPFYLVPRFYLLCMAALTLVGLGLYWLRGRHLHRKMLEKKVEQRTEQLQRENRKTEEQADRLRELDRAKSRFFANLSHEFRTPLTLILGPLRDLLDDPRNDLGEEERRTVERVVRSARRLHGLIDQLLDLARIEADRMPLDRRRMDLQEVVAETVRSFQPWAERKRITLTFSVAVDALTVNADPNKLRRVLGNLLSNALKFTPEDGTVTVTAAEVGGEAVLQVRDTGIGIPEEELPHVFDRFHQVNGTATREHEGTGIGLALAQELVRLHDGTIRAESVPGEGTTFTVMLPLAGGEEAPDVAARGDSAPPRKPEAESSSPVLFVDERSGAMRPDRASAGDGTAAATDAPDDAPTVLVVEDDDEVRSYLRSHLAATYHVREARDGEEALEAIRTERPDLVVSDVMMPKVSGTELVRRLRADEALRDLPIILLTARAGEDERVGGLDIGADDYVEKPFEMPELKARIRGLIERRADLRAQYGREIVMQPTGVSIQDEDEAFYEEARAAVEAHLGNPDFNVKLFVQAMGEAIQNKSRLRRRLKECAGMTPGQFIRHMQMERAAQLIEANPRLRVYEVAGKVGYRDAEAFSRSFRKHFGVLPSQYPPVDGGASSNAW